MSTDDQTKQLIEAVLRQLEADPKLAARLREVLKDPGARDAASRTRRTRRRPPGAFDPFKVFAQGDEPSLRNRLQELNIEQLKDMVAEHGMDPGKLAMKWRTSDRLVDLIATTVRERSRKGDAFRSRPAG